MLLLCNLHVSVPLKAVQHILSSITLCIIHMRRARAQICSRSEFFRLWALSEFFALPSRRTEVDVLTPSSPSPEAQTQ
jgi:hypothetical protein